MLRVRVLKWMYACAHATCKWTYGRHSNHVKCLTCMTMSSGTLSEPPPAPPPTAILDGLTHLTLEQQAVKQSLSNPLSQLELERDGDQTKSPVQTGALVVSQQRPNSQSTAANCLLPYIDPKSEAQPSPSAVTNDLLPQELLLSLKRQQGRALNPLSPPRGATKFPPRHVGNFSPQSKPPPVGPGTNIVNRPPANVWNYPHRRTRLRHLTEAPPCVCGAGRDISFLYDSASPEQEGERVTRAGKANSSLPNTIIPEEYHIVKHPGVLGLEYHDE